MSRILWLSFAPLKVENKSSLWKELSLYQKAKRHPYLQRWEVQGQEGCINKMCYFFTNLLPQVQTSLSFPIVTNLLFLHPKGVKAACFGHLFESMFLWTPVHTKLFLSPFNLPSVHLIIRPAKITKRSKGKISHPWWQRILKKYIYCRKRNVGIRMTDGVLMLYALITQNETIIWYINLGQKEKEGKLQRLLPLV